GLTAGCARCHSHKYDPISHTEFYQLFAYFNNVPERGKAIKYGNSPPYIKAPTREQAKKLAELTAHASAKVKGFHDLDAELAKAQSAWEAKVQPLEQINWSYQCGLVKYLPLMDGVNDVTSNVVTFGPLRHDGNRWAHAFDGKEFVDAGNAGDFGFFDKFTVG